MATLQSVSVLAITSSGRAVYAGAGGRLYRSTDFGQTRVEPTTDLPESEDILTGLVTDPADPNIMHASFGTAVLSKTLDGGVIWQQISAFAGGVNNLAMNPFNPSQLLAGVAARRVAGNIRRRAGAALSA